MTEWVHVGRLWTNGEPYLAMDSVLLPRWRGWSDDSYNKMIVPLPQEVNAVVVGDRAVAVVGVDEGWIEVFCAEDDRVALVQGSGGSKLHEALAHPEDGDLDGGTIEVTKGYLALLNAAIDGTGQYSGELVEAQPGRVPDARALSPSDEPDPGGLLLQVRPGVYRLRVRWMTQLADGSSFARWSLTIEDG
ncbi:MAG TPA: hypothetical protein DGG94_16510 [Micromonosporaceae bacterium]|nr:hypothetical protein [Micromonosporaceae bacterium]HCU51373.1 hypothetical protein [Micromonosporaceae bacterium]